VVESVSAVAAAAGGREGQRLAVPGFQAVATAHPVVVERTLNTARRAR